MSSGRRRFTPSEDDVLLRMRLERKSIDEIAAALGRPRSSVDRRIQRFQLLGFLPTPVRRSDMTLCPQCELAPRTVIPGTSKLRAYCTGCEAEYRADYKETPEGRAIIERWRVAGAAAKRLKREQARAERGQQVVDGGDSPA